MATTTTIVYGAATALTKVANLASLANGAAKVVGVITNTSDLALNSIIEIEITLGSSGVSSTGYIYPYISCSMDGTKYDDGIDATSDADQVSLIKNLKPLRPLIANANNQVVKASFDLVSALGYMPPLAAIIVKNASGAAAAASGYSGRSQSIKIQSA